MLRVNSKHQMRRRGAVLPMVTICLIALVGAMALAVDIGLIADARAEMQDHVDAAVMAAVREMDGVSANNNEPAAQTTARLIVSQNRVFGKLLNSTDTGAGGNVSNLQTGVYRYSGGAFTPVFVAPNAGENYSAATMTLQADQATFFARIFGMTKQTISTKATAVYRPRDLAIVLDYSGSMTFGTRNSLHGTGTSGNSDYGGGSPRFSQNADPNFPRFGPWSIFPKDDPASPSGGTWPISPMQSLKFIPDTGGYSYGPANTTFESASGPPLVNDFKTKLVTGMTSNYNVTAWGWKIRTDGATPLITGGTPAYDPLDLTNPTVMPAPEELANQNHADWPRVSNFGDKFPMKVRTVTGAPAGLDANPADFAFSANEYVNFIITERANLTTDSRLFPISNSTSTAAGTANWFDGTNAFDGTTNQTDFTSSTALNNLHHRGFQTWGYGPDFKGYTMGPGYYGKTFYMWPPDPRDPDGGAPPAQGSVSTSTVVAGVAQPSYRWGDWRRRFFFFNDTNLNDNFWNSGGARRTISASNVNYNAILAWIKSGPKVFPDNLRCGRVKYYTSIPDTITGNGGTPAPANEEERFWKEYIDYVVGAGSYGPSSYIYGTSGSNSLNGQSFGSPTVFQGGLTTPYKMCYADIPIHPRAHFWFGPMTMVDFMLAYTGGRGGSGMMPGACHEAQTWQLKAGVQSALDDIKKNHPNDQTSLIYFSDLSAYATPRAALTDQYDNVKKFLWYPSSIGGSAPSSYLATDTNEIYPFTTAWASNGTGVIPRGEGGTCPEMGFKVAFNQFSASSSAPNGGLGRIGASKIVIFETDGVPNATCGGTPHLGAGNLSYYDGSIGSGGSGSADSNAVAVVTNMRSTTDGFGTRTRVHAIAFGDLMELPLSTAGQNGLNFLADIQNAGGTGMVGTGAARSIQSFKIIRGDYDTRIKNLRTAFENIMQGDVQISLIE